jgi:hypothetical protein
MATPNQEAPGAAAPQSRRRLALWIGLGVAGVLVLCCGGMAALGAIVGPPPRTTKPAAAARTARSTSAAPIHMASPTAAASVSPSPASKPAVAGTTAAPAKPAVPNYAAAAAILASDDEHYRREIAAGPPVLGTPAFTAWWQKASTDTQNMDDFGKADAYFTADNEPTDLLEAWRTDNGQAVTDLYQFAAAEHMAGPGPATADMKRWEDAFNVDMAKADAEVTALRAKH